MPYKKTSPSTERSFQFSPEILALVSLEGRFTEVNTAFEKAFGFSAEEMDGKPFLDLIHPNERPKVLEGIERLRNGSDEVVIETTTMGRNGAFKPILWNWRRLQDEDSFRVFGRDQSEVMGLRKSLEEERVRTMALSEFAREGVLVHDKSVILEASPAAAKIFGFEDPADMVGLKGLDLMAPVSRSAVFKNILTGYDKPYEAVGTRRDGTEVLLEICGRDISYKGRDVRVSTFQDMTGYRKLREAYYESEEKYRWLSEAAPVGFCLSREGRILEVNHALARMFGYEPEELVGRMGTEIIAPESHGVLLRMFTIDSDKPYEVVGSRKDGTRFPLEIHGRPVTYHGNKARIATFTDLTERKRNEQTAREFQDRYQRLAEVSREGILIHDNNIIVDVNQSLANMMGYTVQELLGRDALMFMEKDSVEVVREKVRQGSMGPYEVAARRKDGTLFPIEVRARNFRYNGRDLRVVNFWDITQRKTTEAALKESEERYRLLVESSPEALMVHDEEKILYVNPSGVRLLGATILEDLVGRPFRSIIHPDQHENALERVRRSIREGEANETVGRKLYRLDGEGIDAEVKTIPIVFGGRTAALAIIRDVTSRKKAEEAVRETRESYRRLVEFSPVAILVHDADKVLFINSEGVRMLGAGSPSEVAGSGIQERVAPEFNGVSRERFKELLKGGGTTEPMEQKWRKMDGTEIDVEIRGAFFQYLGRPAILNILRDVTEKKRTDLLLSRYERLAAVGKVIAGIAHDIRNPLAVLYGMTRSLKERSGKDPATLRDMDVILAQTERLKGFMNDILDYSRGLVLTRERVNVEALLRGTLQLVQAQIGPSHAGITVRWEVPADLPDIEGDHERLQQVLLNLFMNAYQAMSENRGVLTISCGASAGWMTVGIKDEGPGISDADMAHLFEPFFTTKKDGSGLGLPLSQRIMEAHGGKIEVQKGSPRGTLLVLQLPVTGNSLNGAIGG